MRQKKPLFRLIKRGSETKMKSFPALGKYTLMLTDTRLYHGHKRQSAPSTADGTSTQTYTNPNPLLLFLLPSTLLCKSQIDHSPHARTDISSFVIQMVKYHRSSMIGSQGVTASQATDACGRGGRVRQQLVLLELLEPEARGTTLGQHHL